MISVSFIVKSEGKLIQISTSNDGPDANRRIEGIDRIGKFVGSFNVVVVVVVVVVEFEV